MPDTQETKLIRQATEIFLRLRDDPDNPTLQQERDEFLACGEAERTAYAKMLQVWQVTGPGRTPGRSTLSAILVAGLLVGGGYAAYDPLRILLLADVSTGYETIKTILASGDQIVLDATSAIADDTEGATRSVSLLRGAAFFDVETDARPFVVTAGDLRVEVTGTAFEVGTFDDGGVVSVAEGSVEVSINGQSWLLGAGERLNWSYESGARLNAIDIANAASWREDTLISDGMTFGQIAAVLDRRLPGDILITNDRLAQTPIVGTFDLSNPSLSLDLLTELTGASATQVPYVVTLIRP